MQYHIDALNLRVAPWLSLRNPLDERGPVILADFRIEFERSNVPVLLGQEGIKLNHLGAERGGVGRVDHVDRNYRFYTAKE
jgi:hypothetical protein